MANTESYAMMALGDYRFGIATAAPEEIEVNSNWRWEDIDRIGTRPALQFIGVGKEVVRLPGILYPAFRGGLGQIDAMKAEANKGEPLLLVDGTGVVWGWFAISDVRQTRQVLFSNGQPRRIEFEICLYRCEDQPQ
jgi:phage protein U